MWNRERCTEGPARRWLASCLRNPKFPESSQRSPFLGKVRVGMVSCWKCLVRSCVPQLRSWSGNMFLSIFTKQMLFSVLTRKGQVRRHNHHPPRSSPGWEETDLCSKRAKCLDPPSRHNWGSQAPRTQLPLAASGHRSARAGPADCVPGRWPRHQITGGDGGEAHRHLKAWARSGQPGEGSWAQQDTAPACSPGPPRSAASLKPCEQEGPGEKAEIRLLTSPSATHHSADWWLKLTTNSSQLRAARLGEGPTAALTSGWAKPLMMAHWQLLAWGRGQLPCRPIAERPLVVSR